MADGSDTTKTLTIRISGSELELIERLRERMQERAPSGIKITQRAVILAALERLKAHLDKLDRDKERQR